MLRQNGQKLTFLNNDESRESDIQKSMKRRNVIPKALVRPVLK
jgi:hypothetical protein